MVLTGWILGTGGPDIYCRASSLFMISPTVSLIPGSPCQGAPAISSGDDAPYGSAANATGAHMSAVSRHPRTPAIFIRHRPPIDPPSFPVTSVWTPDLF